MKSQLSKDMNRVVLALNRLTAMICLLSCTCAHVAMADWTIERGTPEATGAQKQNLPEKLEVLWDFAEGGAFEGTPVIMGDKVYAADAEGGIYCLKLADGATIWTKKIDTGFLAAPAVKDGTLVVGDYDGFIYALSTQDGSEQWKYETQGQIDSGASFHKDHVLVASQDGMLNCLKLSDGSVVWQYETQDQIRCSPTVAGDRTFLGGCDSQLHVVDLNKGEKATEPMPLDSPTNSTPAVIGELAFLPTYGGQILAFEWQKGLRAWEYADPDRAQEYRSSAAATNKIVVVSSQGKKVVGLDATSGKELWQQTIRRHADASPVIAGQSVFLAATDGRLYRFDLTTGKETWTYEVKGALLSAPALADSKLVITTEEGHIMCFGQK